MPRLKIKTHGGSDLAGVFFSTFPIFAFGVRDTDDVAASELNHGNIKCENRSNLKV
jgi:hypothetical protein